MCLDIFDFFPVTQVREIDDAVHGLGDGGLNHLHAQRAVRACAENHLVIIRIAQFRIQPAQHPAEVEISHVVDDDRDGVSSPGAQRGSQGIGNIAELFRCLPDLLPGRGRQSRVIPHPAGNRIGRIAARFGDILQRNPLCPHASSSPFIRKYCIMPARA